MARKMAFHLLLPILTLLLPSSAFSQIELNVKVKPQTTSEAFLKWGQSHSTLLRLPGMDHLANCQKVQSLRSSATKGSPNAIDQLYSVQFADSDAQPRINALLATGQFEWIEENRTIQTQTQTPNDPKIDDQWYHSYIETFAAWDSTRGDATVVVGILDTGIDYGHPEFLGQIAVKAAEDRNGNGMFEPWPDSLTISGVTGDFDGIDQDGNGYTDDVIGWDFTDQPRSPFGGDYLFEDADPMDDNNHGTLVAGIVAAKADNGYGGAGIAPGCKLKIIRAFSANGSGEDDDIARGIVYAADNGIKILNCSFGDIYPSQMMHEAIRYAAAKGVVIIASAGNGTGDNLHYPSNFDEVISVSASALAFGGTTEVLWPLSSYGHAVSLCAPGSNIYAPMVRDTANEEDFDFFSGTSTSAPMVSAAVALLFSQRGECSPQQIRGILTSSADDIGDPGWDHFTGAGRLNIAKALRTVGSSEVQIISPQNDQGSANPEVPIVITALDPQFQTFDLDFMSGIEGTGTWQPILTDQTEQVLHDTVVQWNIAALSDGAYTLRLKMSKTNGTTAEDRIRFVIDHSAPTIELRKVAPAWDNEQRKMLWVYRADDRSMTTLHYRRWAEPVFRAQVNDRITRHGSFLLGIADLQAGGYEYYLSATNEAGLIAQTPLDSFVFSPEFIPLTGFDTLTYSIPMGYYVNATYDFDQDGLLEVAMSEFGNDLSFGETKFYEYNATQFTAADSLTFKPILIPKDVADTDGDGLQELLCSVNDSLYVVEQQASNGYPNAISYSNLDNGLFAARFADADGDGDQAIIAKDFKDYHLLEPANGGSFVDATTLVDDSPDYLGSVSPRALVEDFDGDGTKEIVFGDFDGDFLVYEFNGTGYTRTYLDTTALTKSGSFLTAGDFDGDGVKEFFVAVHTSLNRNEEDFEYEPLYWWLRIFKANGNNQYAVVWEDLLFDVDTEEYNAATAGNLDLDAADELIFTTFPRTYVVDFSAGSYKMDWFHYGDIATQHVIGDFNGNGVGEVAIGRGDKAIFWEKDFSYAGPQTPAYLDGHVVSGSETYIHWSAASNATDYRIWRGPILASGSILITLIDSTNATDYHDTGLTAGTNYLYVVESKNLALTPEYSPFSYAIVLRPHALGKLDSVVATGPQQGVAYFSVPIHAAPENAQHVLLNDSTTCATLNASGDANRQVLLSFAAPFVVGTNRLTIDSLFWDADRAPLDSLYRSPQFEYAPDSSGQAFFTHWSIENPHQALIAFNYPMTSSVLDPQLYHLEPSGVVTEVTFADAQQKAIIVTVDEAAFGALGYPVSVTLNGGIAQNGAPMRLKSGNVATFSAFKADLTSAYVYPNPFRQHSEFNGIRFANLTRTATVHVYTVSGKKIITLQETDGDGGLEWNMVDLWGDRIVPGTYIFRVESEEQEDFVGKFEVLE